MILLLRKSDRFPNPLSIHITPLQAVLLYQFINIPAIVLCAFSHPLYRQLSAAGPSYHARSYPLHDTSIHNSGNFPLWIFSISHHLWFSRPRVLGWHHTGAPNLKATFFVCDQTCTIQGAPQIDYDGFNSW